MLRVKPLRTFVLTAAIALMAQVAQAQLSFNFNPAVGMSAQAIAGFQAAGARFSALFDDSITVFIDIDFAALGPGILAQAGSTEEQFSYANTRTALINDKTTGDDNTATANLQAGPAIQLLMNRTSNSPNGSGSATPFLDNDGDANNTTIRMSTANAKALGLHAGNDPASDAAISFSSSFVWDFDPSDGITPGAFDFVGIATHEIGHALGFISGVDTLDTNSPPIGGPFSDNQFTFVNVLDLYRYSALSQQFAGTPIDWSADNRAKFFSIDGGTTNLALFSNGVFFGDQRQASHWKDNLGIGTMDPTAAPGELLTLSARDIQAFDVIGYTFRRVQDVPEPSSVLALALGCVAVIPAVAKRRRSTRN